MATVVVNFEANVEELRAALAAAEGAAEDTAAGLDKTTTSAKTAGSSLTKYAKFAAGAATAAAAAAVSVGLFAKKVADSINDLNDMSARTGVSARQLKALQLAAESSGQGLQNLDGVLRKVALSGLSLEEVADEIQSIEDPTARAAKAMELLGEEGGRLVQALGDRRFDEFQEFVDEFGTKTGPAASEAAATFQRRLAETKTIMAGLVSGPGVALLTWLNDFAVNGTRTFLLVQGALTTTVKIFREVAQAFVETGKGLIAFGPALGAGMVKGFRMALQGMSFAEIERRLNQELDEAAQAIGGPAREMVENVNRVIEEGMQSTLSTIGTYNRLIGETAPATTAAAVSAAELSDSLGEVAESVTEIGVAAPSMIGLADPIFGIALAGDAVARALQNAAEELERLAAKERKLAKIQSTLGAIATGGEVVSTVATGIGDAFAAFGKKSEKAAKIAFAANKAAGIADAVVKTAQAIMNTFATLPLPVALGVAPFVAATGAAQIATIAATTFDGGGGAPPAPSGAGASSPGVSDVATSGGVTKGAEEDTAMRRGTSGGGTYYRHRDLDIVARDGRRYIGGAFDPGGSTGQVRYDR